MKKHGNPTASITDKATVNAQLVKPIFEKLKRFKYELNTK